MENVSHNHEVNYWEKYASEFDTLYELRRKFFLCPALIDMAGDIKGKSIVDLGCGLGHNTNDLRQQGADVIGVDQAKNMLDRAQNYYPAIPFIQGDAENLSALIPKRVDGVIASQVFLTIPSREKIAGIFSEVSKILKPNGFFIFTDVHFFRRDEMRDHFLELHFPNEFSYFQSGFIYNVILKAPGEEATMEFKDTFWNLSDYMQFIKAGGFVIEDIAEPKPQENMPEEIKPYFTHYRENPLYIMFRLKKDRAS